MNKTRQTRLLAVKSCYGLQISAYKIPAHLILLLNYGWNKSRALAFHPKLETLNMSSLSHHPDYSLILYIIYIY